MQRFWGDTIQLPLPSYFMQCKKNLTDSDLLFPEKAESLPQDQKKKYAEKVCDERESDKQTDRDTKENSDILFGRILNSFKWAEDRG